VRYVWYYVTCMDEYEAWHAEGIREKELLGMNNERYA
jgi:hypothetical protein